MALKTPPRLCPSGLRHKFASHGLLFDLGAALTRVRHAAVALASVALRAAAAAAPSAAAAAPPLHRAGGRAAAAAHAEQRAAADAAELEAALRFAYRVHQFAGGFDGATAAAFQALAQRVTAALAARGAEPEQAARE